MTPPDDAVTPVKQAVNAELASLPTGEGSTEVFDDLNRALLHRAALDDQVRGRRQERARELHALVEAITPGAPEHPDELLELLWSQAPSLNTAAASDPRTAEKLRAIASLLVETDLVEVAPGPSEKARDDSTLYRAATTPSVTEAQLMACLREHAVPGAEVHEISDLHVLSGGFSKEMLAVTIRRSHGSEELVIRKVASGRTAATLSGEYTALNFAWAGGVPVAEPLWLDGTALGSPAFATRRARGRCLGDVWGPSEPVGREAGNAIASALARLHSLDTDQLSATPLPPMATNAQIAASLDEREEVLQDVSSPAAPFAALFALVLGWLRARTPADVVRPVLVHGDFGLHNLLLEESAVTAVLDWERAHVGHAAEDLTYLRPSIEPVLPWQDFLDAYQRAGGEAPATDHLDFYAVWHDLWRGVSAYRMRSKFISDPTRISDAMAGLLMSPRFLLRAAHSAFGLPVR